jgi:hypothetical protein
MAIAAAGLRVFVSRRRGFSKLRMIMMIMVIVSVLGNRMGVGNLYIVAGLGGIVKCSANDRGEVSAKS